MIDLPEGARVVIRLPNGPDLAAALLDCFDRGLVAVPLHPRTTETDLAAITDRVRASAVVTREGTRATGLTAAHPAAAGLALIMFTSGSTGRPKGVMLSRSAVLGNAAKTAALHGIAPDRPHGTCLPLYHCNALVMSLMGTHLTGAPLVLHPTFDPAGYFAALAQGGARTASIVPALLADLVEVGPPWPDGLDYLITAAAPLTTDLARRFHDRYGDRLRQGYGLTEAVNFSFTAPRLTGTDFTADYLDRHPPVGEPLPGTEVRIESGEVWIRTPDLMDGYWEDPAATADAVTPDGWLRTGDLGELRDGYLVLRGRAKERIDRGGEKYHPLDIERGWRETGLTGRFAAVAVPEPTLGHEIGLVAEDHPVDDIRALCEQAAHRPAVVRIGGYTTTATGKPQRTAMGRGLAARRVVAARYERLLRHAAATAREIATGPLRDKVSALARHPEAEFAPPDEPIIAAYDFLREHQHDPMGDHLADAKREWRERLAREWPLTVYADLAEALGAPTGTTLGEWSNGSLLVLPHAAPRTTPDGTPWALDLLWAFLVTTDPTADRWARLRDLRASGATEVGATFLRAGRHDLGGVVWARPLTPWSEEHP